MTGGGDEVTLRTMPLDLADVEVDAIEAVGATGRPGLEYMPAQGMTETAGSILSGPCCCSCCLCCCCCG